MREGVRSSEHYGARRSRPTPGCPSKPGRGKSPNVNPTWTERRSSQGWDLDPTRRTDTRGATIFLFLTMANGPAVSKQFGGPRTCKANLLERIPPFRVCAEAQRQIEEDHGWGKGYDARRGLYLNRPQVREVDREAHQVLATRGNCQLPGPTLLQYRPGPRINMRHFTSGRAMEIQEGARRT